ncbi:hypothetical protein [Microbacterium kyungheense]|uniref:Transcriptional regulator, AbiEi antitoxin, Type IV TA system n=1 Tax=Microbacterium kyungheense TaxID=1263636 RepID=A0A543F1V0_9MICO|nr:hypothetical protein [Microbacterium kyungheense]TQM27805.1 hypothetical protein FB391_1833 [Microbacterium kyungheense]
MPLLTLPLQIRPSPVMLLRSDDVPHPERAVARGDLVKVQRGVYAPFEAWHALAPWTRYLARVHATLLARPDALFSHESAAALLGGPVFGDPGTVHVLAPASGEAGQVSGIRTHTTRDDRGLILLGGVAVTSPAETAVDLARSRHPAIGLAVADAMLRLDPELSGAVMAEMNEKRSSRRGRDVARWSLRRATPLAESSIESVSRAVIEWLGFPAPELQVSFESASGDVDRGDFVWERPALGGESDGDLKFDGRYGDSVSALRRQRARDARLREHLDAIAHWGWTDATTFVPLSSLLQGMGLPVIAPENVGALMAMRRQLASRAPLPASPPA